MPLNGDDDVVQIEQVVERLCAQFPLLTRTEVERVVHSAHGRFIGSRIREFVPLLVEKAAKQVLNTAFLPTAATSTRKEDAPTWSIHSPSIRSTPVSDEEVLP